MDDEQLCTEMENDLMDFMLNPSDNYGDIEGTLVRNVIETTVLVQEALNDALPHLFWERVQHSRPTLYSEEWVDRYVDSDFHRLFRMRKDTFEILLHTLDQIPWYAKEWTKGLKPIDARKKTLMGIEYLATQLPLRRIGDKFNVCDKTVSECAEDFCRALCQIAKSYIAWPTREECRQISEEFQDLANFPGVIGAIDGCHIEGKFLKNIAHYYVNRKGRKSVVLLGVGTSRKLFTNVFIGAPGRVHDARVLSLSSITTIIDQHGANALFYGPEYHLVADSAFSLEMYCMVRYKKNAQNMTDAEENYNTALSTTRVVIENIFGLLKKRWQRILYIDVNTVEKFLDIIQAACVMHNFCLLQDDFLEEILSKEVVPLDLIDRDANYPDDDNAAIAKRDYIKAML